MLKKIYAVRVHSVDLDYALLFVRLVVGLAFMYHGWGKTQNPMGWMGPDAQVPGFLQALAAIAEFGGGLAFIIGLLTRLAAFGLACTMLVAVITHKFIMGDPFVNLTGGGAYEIAAVYFTISLLFLIDGPGRFSLDRKIFGVRTHSTNSSHAL